MDYLKFNLLLSRKLYLSISLLSIMHLSIIHLPIYIKHIEKLLTYQLFSHRLMPLYYCFWPNGIVLWGCGTCTRWGFPGERESQGRCLQNDKCFWFPPKLSLFLNSWDVAYFIISSYWYGQNLSCYALLLNQDKLSSFKSLLSGTWSQLREKLLEIQVRNCSHHNLQRRHNVNNLNLLCGGNKCYIYTLE